MVTVIGRGMRDLVVLGLNNVIGRRLAVVCCCAIGFFYALPAQSMDLCPRVIETAQNVPIVPPGYEVIELPAAQSKLTFVEFFAGHPESLGSLIPSASTDSMRTWNFGPRIGNHKIWIGCHYSNTKLMLTYQIPESIKICKVRIFDRARGFIQGSLQIDTIECE